MIIIIIWISASWGVTEEGGLCCCLLLPYSCHNLHTYLCFSSLSIFINYSYPKYDCYICLKYVEEKRHCTTLNKWWSDNDMMMLGWNIIVQHHINDGQTMTWWCLGESLLLKIKYITETQWQDDVRDKHHWTTLYKWLSKIDKVILEKHHCLQLNKWWSDNDKMMFERIIIA